MVHLIKNEFGKTIGWELKPITPEEQQIVAKIRDLQFFGFDDTYPEYNGLTLIDPKLGKRSDNIKSIGWLMRKYKNFK